MTPRVTDYPLPSEHPENTLGFRASVLCGPVQREPGQGAEGGRGEMVGSHRKSSLSANSGKGLARPSTISRREDGGAEIEARRKKGSLDGTLQSGCLSKGRQGAARPPWQVGKSCRAPISRAEPQSRVAARKKEEGEKAVRVRRAPVGLRSEGSAIVGVREENSVMGRTASPPRAQAVHGAPDGRQRPRWSKRVEISADYRSSRLIVKNLPPYLTSADLVGHLSSLGGEVTDVCLLKNEKGRSRQCAFVGFKTQKQATDVKAYFNRTFIHTRKIEIDYAMPRTTAFERKDRTEATARSRKRRTAGEVQAEERERKVARVQKRKIGAATVIKEEVKDTRKAGISDVRTRVIFDEDDSSLEETDCCEVSSDRGSQSGGAGGQTAPVLGVTEPSVPRDDDDLSWLRRQSELNSTLAPGAHTAHVPALEETRSERTGGSSEAREGDEDGDIALLGSHGRLLIQNLPFATTTEELKALCSQHGEVAEVHLVTDEESHKPKGFGFVTFVFPEHAVASLSSLNNSIFQGRVLQVVPARPDTKREQRLQRREEQLHLRRRKTAGSSFKALQHQKRLEQEQKKATEDRVWNLLYVSANAAADAVLGQLQADKGDLLLNGEDSRRGRGAADFRTGNTTAATVALMESHLLNQTKEWIKAEGISLDAFERRGTTLLTAEYRSRSENADYGSEEARKNQEHQSKEYVRSRDTLIVKHLPVAHVEGAELLRLFERIGPLARFLLAPSKTVAIVQFEKERDAEVAFRKLAYRKYKNIPLFLEKAPVNIFTERVAEEAEAHAAAVEETKAAKLAERALEESGEGAEDEEEPPAVVEEEEEPKKLESKGMSRSDQNMVGVAHCPGAVRAAGSQKRAEASIDARTALEEDEEYQEAGPSLFVKNINFATSEACLNQAFAVCPGLRHTRLMTKKRPVTKRAGSPVGEEQSNAGSLSMGYAFVEFDSVENAVGACKRMQGAVVDGHTLQISLSRSSMRTTSGTGDFRPERGATAGASGAQETHTRKLLVRNLAFQASAADLRGLFSAYGTVTRVRIPTQHEGRSRGFGFVDFATKQEARNALQGVNGSHLYGRRLVLEFAKQESLVKNREP